MMFDWEAIRTRYEKGETAGMIARSPNMPTRQCINRKARREGWERKQESFPVPAAGTVINVPTDLDPRRRAALEVISQGGTLKDAAAAACVSESSFRRWREDDAYQALIERAESGIRLEMLNHVRAAAATDLKAATWWLSRHPASRADFGEHPTSLTVGTMNILKPPRPIIDRGPVIGVHKQTSDTESD